MLGTAKPAERSGAVAPEKEEDERATRYRPLEACEHDQDQIMRA
jgi:hypothetical protein